MQKARRIDRCKRRMPVAQSKIGDPSLAKLATPD
jgi:hypothetical protein